MKIYFGVENFFRDVTFAYMTYHLRGLEIHIPASDEERVSRIGDHLPGIEKMIIIITRGRQINIPTGVEIRIRFQNELDKIIPRTTRFISKGNHSTEDIQHELCMFMGSFEDESPEQRLAVKYVKPNAKVLEIGANIGRNTMILSSLLNDDTNLVTLECNRNFIELLELHKKLNKMNFQIVNAALSYRPLAIRDWDTVVIENDCIPENYERVECVTFEELKSRFFNFDTLVADCEGALYYILQDNRELFQDFETIIIENDYHDIEHYNFIRTILDKTHVCIHSEGGGWGPCTHNFYEVFTKK